MKHVFIVGCPRSGSTWTTFLLAQHPAVATFQHARVFDYLVGMQRWHHNKSGHSFIVQPDAEEAPDSGKSKNLRLADVLPIEALYPLLRPVAEGIMDHVAAARPGASVVVDKTPEHGLIAEFILKVLPDAYFLHIVRDPRAVFCSQRSASRSWAKWEFPTQPIDGARLWNRDCRAALGIESLTKRYLQVRYEDMQRQGPAELQRILSWLELPSEEGFCERAVEASSKDKLRPTQELPQGFVRKAPTGGWRDELSPRDARVIEHLAGDLMESLGYERSQPPYRGTPWRVRLHDAPVPLLSFLDRKLHRLAQLAHWRWVGRKLEWPEP